MNNNSQFGTRKKGFVSFCKIAVLLLLPFIYTSCGGDDSDDEYSEKSANTTRYYKTCPDDRHPHLIDLGLPSGTKWACCNIGADKPEAYGSYYAWGEIEEKHIMSDHNYLNGKGIRQNIGKDIAGTKYDVAHMKWGGSWVMPSSAQYEELCALCVCKGTIENGVAGCMFTGLNGGSVFLPHAGEFWGEEVNHSGEYGDYWTSNTIDESLGMAIFLYFNGGHVSLINSGLRSTGLSVRPVAK